MKTPRPFGLLAELTYRCPLRCPYCSNPTKRSGNNELSTAEWVRVISQAAKLGIVQIGLSGGEPLLRGDLEEIVSAAAGAGLYSNLITSAIGLDESRAARLKHAGLDSIQISFQADEAELADATSGAHSHAAKLKAVEAVRGENIPLSINVVLHHRNISRIGALIEFAWRAGAHRLELANVQYYGWALLNRAALLPTREQVESAAPIVASAQERYLGKMDILYVLPDYFTGRPKPCMHGWGSRQMTVNPYGSVMPCPSATVIKELAFENIRDRELGDIWTFSSAFNRFRGTEWMQEPCASCELRHCDFGGCRCQAAILTGNAAATDPACELSPDHSLVTAAHGSATREFTYRSNSEYY